MAFAPAEAGSIEDIGVADGVGEEDAPAPPIHAPEMPRSLREGSLGGLGGMIECIAFCKTRPIPRGEGECSDRRRRKRSFLVGHVRFAQVEPSAGPPRRVAHGVGVETYCTACGL